MTTTTETHDSTICTCSICRWANERHQQPSQPSFTAAEINALAASVLERVRADLSEPWGFDDDWELAPLSRTRYVERGDAEFWYQMGARAKEREMLVQQNADMRELLRARKAGQENDLGR